MTASIRFASVAFAAGLSAASFLGGASARAQDFFFHDGDRPIILIGDSITEQRMYTTLIETYVLSRFPEWKVTFRNVGWSGDVSWLGLRKGFDTGMKRDLLSLKPMAATIDYGMNDARGGDNNLPLYTESMSKMVAQLQEAGSRVAVLTPSPEERYEDGQPGGSGYNHMLEKFSAACKTVAKDKQAWFADQFAPFLDVIAKGRSAGVLGTGGNPRLIPDGVHPNWAGHLVMAAAILDGLGAPALVSRLEIDGAGRSITDHQGCDAEVLAGGPPKGIAVRRVDAALPWPIPSEAGLALKIPGYAPLQRLSRYELAVTKLKPGSYDLAIDDRPVGSYSAAELAAGINLTTAAGPIGEQCAKILAKVIEKNNVFYARWRAVQLFEAPAWLAGDDIEPKRAAELTRLDAQIVAMEADIDALRKPVPHVFSIAPAAPTRPLALRAIATVGAKGVALSWKPGDDTATGYAVERSADGVAFTEVGRATGATAWTDAEGTAEASYRVRALGVDALSPPSLIARAGDADGFAGHYFAQPGMAGPAVERIDTAIDADWSAAGPAPGVGQSGWSARWTAVLTAPETATYTFAVTSDDGTRLRIDRDQVIDQWRDQAPTESTASVALKAGESYEITLEYFQGGGGAMAKFEWSWPGHAREVVPAARVRPAR